MCLLSFHSVPFTLEYCLNIARVLQLIYKLKSAGKGNNLFESEDQFFQIINQINHKLINQESIK